MATFRKRGERWQAQIRRADHPPISKSFRTKGDAQVWARAIESALDDGDEAVVEADAAARLTLADLLERYRVSVTPGKKSRVHEECRIKNLLADPIAKIAVGDLTSGKVADYRDRRLRKVGPQAVIHDLILLGHVIKIAINEWDLTLATNPVSKVKKPKQPFGRTRRLRGDEEQRLYRAARSLDIDYLEPLITLALETGMRQSELLGLKWEHIDLDRSIALLPDTKNGFPRNVPLSSRAKAALAVRRLSGSASPFPIIARRAQRAWEKALAHAGIEDLHFHDLRHESISRLFERGLTVPEVAFPFTRSKLSTVKSTSWR